MDTGGPRTSVRARLFAGACAGLVLSVGVAAAGLTAPGPWSGTAVLTGGAGVAVCLLAFVVDGLLDLRAAPGPAPLVRQAPPAPQWVRDGRMFWPARSLDGRSVFAGRWVAAPPRASSKAVAWGATTCGLVLLWVALWLVGRTGPAAEALAVWISLLPVPILAGTVMTLVALPGRPAAPLGPYAGEVWQWRPPPGWPVPAGFVPEPGWQPEPSWPDAPDDWRGWVLMSASVPVWPPQEQSVQDGVFVHDGVIWWPLRAPGGRLPVARSTWGPALLAGTGALLLLVAYLAFVVGGLMSMGAAPDRPPPPGGSSIDWPRLVLLGSLAVGVAGVVALVVAPRRFRAARRPRLADGGLEWTWTPPPGWPAAPAGFTPAPGWRPDPAWPPPPEDWRGWSVSVERPGPV